MDSGQSLPLAPNLLRRDFTVEAPDLKWSSDITCIEMTEGCTWPLHSHQVVDWRAQPRMQTSLITDAVRMAWCRPHTTC